MDTQTRRRRASLKQHESTPLTTETVNNYVHIDEMDDEVPLYTAMKLEKEDAIEAILELNPDVFLGVKYYDKINFEQKTAAGLYLELERSDGEGWRTSAAMQKYMSAVATKLTQRFDDEWKERADKWLNEHPEYASSIDSILYSYKKLKL
jgi:hypothetical protein